MGSGADRVGGLGNRGLRLGVLVAMEKEYRLLLARMPSARPVQLGDGGRLGLHALEAHRGALGQHGYVLARSGIGKVNAALAAQCLLASEPLDGVLSVGVSGGLAPDAEPGQLMVGLAFAYHDVWCGAPNSFGQVQGLPPSFTGCEMLVRRLRGAAPQAVAGLFLCGEFFVPEQEAVRRMQERFPGALAVDMESCAVAQTCYVHGVPFASLRIVSDTPGRSADHHQQYAQFWEEQAGDAFGALAAALSAL